MFVVRKGLRYEVYYLEKQNNIKFSKGRTYIFENGEVEKDEMGSLSLQMPWSGIQ